MALHLTAQLIHLHQHTVAIVKGFLALTKIERWCYIYIPICKLLPIQKEICLNNTPNLENAV